MMKMIRVSTYIAMRSPEQEVKLTDPQSTNSNHMIKEEVKF